MKQIFRLIFLLAFSGVTFAQNDEDEWNLPGLSDFPTIVGEAADCNGFVPMGWTMTTKIEGDLNGDKLADCVVVTRGTSSKFIFENDGLGVEKFDTNPRVLVIAFRNSDGRGYRLAEQNNRFIIAPASPVMGEPYQDALIKNGVLSFTFDEFYSAGTYAEGNRVYKFRFQKGEFVLIGLDYGFLHRGSGRSEMRSYNFSTGKLRIESGDSTDTKSGKVKVRNFRLTPMKNLKTVPPMLTWEIEKDLII
jgi:hypothetical protein